MFGGEIMKYNSNTLSFIFIFIAIVSYIAYIVRDTLRLHPILVLSISLLALLGNLVFINQTEDKHFPSIILIGILIYFILFLSTLLIELIIRY